MVVSLVFKLWDKGLMALLSYEPASNTDGTTTNVPLLFPYGLFYLVAPEWRRCSPSLIRAPLQPSPEHERMLTRRERSCYVMRDNARLDGQPARIWSVLQRKRKWKRGTEVLLCLCLASSSPAWKYPGSGYPARKYPASGYLAKQQPYQQLPFQQQILPIVILPVTTLPKAALPTAQWLPFQQLPCQHQTVGSCGLVF